MALYFTIFELYKLTKLLIGVGYSFLHSAVTNFAKYKSNEYIFPVWYSTFWQLKSTYEGDCERMAALHGLFNNRSVSKIQTPFTTKTVHNFSRKTLPWLGSGISLGVGGQLTPKHTQARLWYSQCNILANRPRSSARWFCKVALHITYGIRRSKRCKLPCPSSS